MGSHMVLYKRGVACDTFTLVLQGRVLVWAGQEEFPSELGPWQSAGTKALFSESYRPDFSACTTGPCRLIQISRAAFLKVRRAARWAVGSTNPHALCDPAPQGLSAPWHYRICRWRRALLRERGCAMPGFGAEVRGGDGVCMHAGGVDGSQGP